MKYNAAYREDVAESIQSIPQVEKLKEKSILITGGTGMICSTVADILFYLNQYGGYRMTILLAGRNREKMIQRFPYAREGADYHFLPFDAETGRLGNIRADFLIHGASPADPRSFERKPAETIMTNVSGLKAVLDQALFNKGSRALYISSSEVYGRKKDSSPFKENDYGFVDILNPRSCYPNAKRLGETLCAAYGKEYGVNTVIVRPGHIYGPSIPPADSRATAQFTRNALSKSPIIMKSAGTQLRSYCYTLDCASALLTVIINGKSGEAYNISNSRSIITIRQIAEAFARAAGMKLQFENPTDQEKAGYNLMDNSSLDSRKLESLGWKGCFDLVKGVKRTLEFAD